MSVVQQELPLAIVEGKVVTDVPQDRADGGGTRVNIGVDAQRFHQRDQRGVIDQRDDIGAAFGFGAHAGQHVGLVVIGDRHHRIGAANARFGKQGRVQPVTVKRPSSS